MGKLYIMADETKTTVLRIIQTVLGAIMFMAMFYVYVIIKEFPIWLFGFPGILLGVDPSSILGGKK